jgi:hypothetical protein
MEAIFQQVSFFDLEMDTEVVEMEKEPLQKRKPHWNPKERSFNRQISVVNVRTGGVGCSTLYSSMVVPKLFGASYGYVMLSGFAFLYSSPKTH